MKHINIYITEAWGGVKKQVNKVEIEAWCDEMGIKNYTINSQGEIDVDGNVDLRYKDFEELPYKFGEVSLSFYLINNKNLKTLKNCPNYVGRSFNCSGCLQLDSLEGCPKKIVFEFFCTKCKRKFTKKEVQKYCNVKTHDIFI